MLFIFTAFTFTFAKEVVALPQLVNPQKFFLDIESNQLIVVERVEIHIYSLKGFKHKKSFGKAGEGPGEFRLSPAAGYNKIKVNLQPDSILVSSLGKLAVFTKEGKLKREQPIPPYILELKGLNGKYVGWKSALEDGVSYWMVNLYDAKINQVKELFRMKNTYQPGEGLTILSRTLLYETCRNRVFITSSEEFKLDVFDSSGKYLSSIRQDYRRLKFTPADKEKCLNWFKVEHKQVYQHLHNQIHFPRYFPSIRALNISDKIYIITYDKEGEKSGCLIFDKTGKFKTRKFLPLKFIDIRTFYPYVIHRGRLYQLIDDPDTGIWALHITDIN
jgi:hypothetical protein